MSEDTRRCGLCESLYHAEVNCPHGPPPPRFHVIYRIVGGNDVWGVMDRQSKKLVTGSLSFDEDKAWSTADRLNAEQESTP